MDAVIQVRVDESLKTQAVTICKKSGLDLSTVIRALINTIVKKDCIPADLFGASPEEKFRQSLEKINNQAEQKGLSNLSLEDINKIIKETREELKKNK